MIVSVDMQAAVGQRAGVGRFVRSLAEHLGTYAGEDTLRLFYFDFKRRGLAFPVHGVKHRAVRWVPGRIVQRAWKQMNWPPSDWFAGSADIHHFTNFILPPLRRGAGVVSIYDVSFLRFPEAAEPRNLAYLQSRMPDTIARADAILTISECCRRDILERLGASPDQVFVIYPGLDHAPRDVPADEVAGVRRRLGLDRPYFLMVGTLEPRKNHAFLVDVFEALDSFDGDLVLAGMPGWKTEPILDRIACSPRGDRIRLLDFVSDRDLASLYAGAELFVFPSHYEGFGFPPLEAMTVGIPVIASTGGSLPEVLGDAAILCDANDRDAWVDAIQGALDDQGARAAMVERGKARAAQYTWDRAALETWKVYRKIGQCES